MKEILTEKEIKMVESLAQEMQKEANDDMSLEENMQISLAGRTENLDEKEEVSNICKGIRDFDEVLGQLEAGGGKDAIIKELERSALNGKSTEEQYRALAEALESFQADLASKGYDFEGMKSLEIKKDEDVTEDMLDGLKALVGEYLDKFSLLHGEAELMESFFQAIGVKDCEKLLQAYGNEERKYYMALAIYILHLQGDLSYMPLGMGAREIGVNVSASFASAKAHIEGVMGKIPKEEVLEKLKKIAGAALTILAGAAIGLAAFKIGQLVFWLSSMVFGLGLAGILVAVALSVACQVKTIDVLLKTWEELKEITSDAKEYLEGKYVVVKQWVLEEAVPALKEFWEKLKEKVSCLPRSFGHAEESEDAYEDEGFMDDTIDADVAMADA